MKRTVIWNGILGLGLAASIGAGVARAETYPPNICLQAKGGYGACVSSGLAEPMCIAADNGYADCVKGGDAERLCVKALAGYGDCRKDGYSRVNCLGADAGYADCRAAGESHAACLGVKGGYAPCRAAGLSHRACVAADSDFLLCRREGIAASDCGRATPAYSICRADGQSPHFCLAASNGYGACRQLGFPPSYCLSAGDGFKDCTIRHSGRSAAAVNWLALLTTGLNAPPDSSPPSPTPPAAPVTPAQPEKVIDWADPESRTHYLILAEKRSYVHAFLACDNRGWSLFNPDALDSREWDRFVKSPVYQAMPWTVRFAGDPGEIREAAYWTSRNYSDSTGASADAVTLRLRKVDGKIETRHGEYVSAVDGPLFTTFCMFRGKTWFRCSADQKCTTYTFTTTPGEPSYEIPEITDTTRIEDSGETEDAAWQLLLKIGQAHKAAGGLGAPYDCTMDQASVSCTQEH